jgi:serine/threonine protein kinase
VEHLGAGSVIAGRYVLAEPVSPASARDPRGVWRAVDRLTSEDVAVKLLAAYPADDAAARMRFRLVGMAALQLSHPGIAQVHDFGETVLPGGLAVPYFIRELAGGQTLAERLAQGPLPAGEALRIAASAAATLTVAHRAGMAHGHLVPANVVLAPDQVKLTDFGLAPVSGQTEPADAGGILSYTAPELAGGGPATPAADMYALGVVLTACLTGIPSLDSAPDAGPAGALGPPAPAVVPDTMPAGVAALWAACLGPSPVDRPTAAHAAVMSRQALAGTPALMIAEIPPRIALTDFRAEELTASHRPVVDHSPVRSHPVADRAPQPSHPPTRSRPRRRLATVGKVAAATTATSGVLVLLMFALAHEQDQDTAGHAAAGHRTPAAASRPASRGGSSPAQATTSPPAPPRPLAVIRRISATIRAYAGTGQIRPDVSTDLDNLIQPVATDLLAGRTAPVTQLADTLRAKVATRLGEGAMSPAAARALDAEISLLSRSRTARR